MSICLHKIFRPLGCVDYFIQVIGPVEPGHLIRDCHLTIYLSAIVKDYAAAGSLDPRLSFDNFDCDRLRRCEFELCLECVRHPSCEIAQWVQTCAARVRPGAQFNGRKSAFNKGPSQTGKNYICRVKNY